MAGTAANVKTYGDGIVLTAPLETALPATTVATVDAAFVDLGFLTEDGISEALNVTTAEQRVWQGAAVVSTSVTDSSVEISFSMAEDAEMVKTVFYGVAAASGIRNIDPAVRYRGAWVLHLIDTGGTAKRMVIADGEVIAREAVTYSNAGPAVFGITLKCYPNAATGGKAYREVTAAS